MTQVQPQRPLRLFCSYAHEDAEFRRQLHQALAGLERLGLIQRWADTDIRPGDDWHAEIDENLESADVIIFLVTNNLVASDYAIDVEFRRALQRRSEGVWVIPILAEDLDYYGTPFKKLQAMVCRESEGEPVALELWTPRSTAYKLVSQAIRRYVQSRARQALPQEPVMETPPPVPHGFWAPDRKRLPVGRDELIERLADELRRAKSGVVALVGGGGSGKTTVALEYTWRHGGDYDLAAWLQAEDPDTLAWDVLKLAEHIGVAASNARLTRDRLRRWLGTPGRWLLIFDNAVDRDLVQRQLPDYVGGHVLITSRERVWERIATELELEPLAAEDACRLLMEYSGDRDEASAAELAELLQRNPKALEQAAAHIRRTQGTLAGYLRDHRLRLGATAA